MLFFFVVSCGLNFYFHAYIKAARKHRAEKKKAKLMGQEDSKIENNKQLQSGSMTRVYFCLFFFLSVVGNCNNFLEFFTSMPTLRL